MSEENEQKAHQLESLNQQLEKVRALSPEPKEAPQPGANSANAAIDFGSGVAVGGLLGFGFDRWQHTLPWGLLIGLAIGAAAGIRLMFQVEKNRQNNEPK